MLFFYHRIDHAKENYQHHYSFNVFSKSAGALSFAKSSMLFNNLYLFYKLSRKKVSVIPTDPLYVVNPIFPGYKKVYFNHGEILDPNKSFNYYGVTNGDRIVTVPIEQMSINTELF
jgi:hypothetical protein